MSRMRCLYFISTALIVLHTKTVIANSNYSEEYRLQLHYSVPKGWMNDPNGLVFHNGTYHLFYQFNPASNKWDTMHWGHAVSTDLVHWENLPVALKPYEKGSIFSGCALSDIDNVTGLGNPLVAIYTLNDKSNVQSQAMAYSFDNGYSWAQLKSNPIIPNPSIIDFRDPNVRLYDGVYYMSVAAGDRVLFYASSNLIDWIQLSEFGISPNYGDKSGVWECPSLFRLKDEEGIEHDVLIVSENGDNNGSMTQYFIGKFNGTHFNSKYYETLWLDNGPDNYASVPYVDDPKERLIIIGWMSNWKYAQDIPTSTWRGQMTLPREVGLKTVNNHLYVTQKIPEEFEQQIDSSKIFQVPSPITLSDKSIINISCQMPFRSPLLNINYILDLGKAAKGKIGFSFSNILKENVSFSYNIEDGTYGFDRRNSGQLNFSSFFTSEIINFDRISNENVLRGRIVLDVSSIEVFADEGLNVLSAIFFPNEPFEEIVIYRDVDGQDAEVTFRNIEISALSSIWS